MGAVAVALPDEGVAGGELTGVEGSSSTLTAGDVCAKAPARLRKLALLSSVALWLNLPTAAEYTCS